MKKGPYHENMDRKGGTAVNTNIHKFWKEACKTAEEHLLK